MIAVSIVFWLSLSFGGPFHLRLWAVMYPARLVGRVVGVIGMGRAAAGALAAFGGGVLADRLGGEQAVARGGRGRPRCARSATSACASAPTERPADLLRPRLVRALRERPFLGRIALAQGFYGGGLIAAVPLFALVHVDRLDLSLSDVGVIGILAADRRRPSSFLVWGVGRRSLRIARWSSGWAAWLGLLSLLAYASRRNVAFLWVAAIFTGIATASIDLGFASAMSDSAPLAVAGGGHGRLERR